MKLEEINNIEILRNKLKEMMVKCIKNYNIYSICFKNNEWYKIEIQDDCDYSYIRIYNDKNEGTTFFLDNAEDRNKLLEYFDLAKFEIKELLD